METKLTIGELTAKVDEELTKLGYSYNSICGFRSFRFQAFAQSQERFFLRLGKKFSNSTDVQLLQSYPQGPARYPQYPSLGDYQLHMGLLSGG